MLDIRWCVAAQGVSNVLYVCISVTFLECNSFTQVKIVWRMSLLEAPFCTTCMCMCTTIVIVIHCI